MSSARRCSSWATSSTSVAVERQALEHGARELHGRASAGQLVEVAAALGEVLSSSGDHRSHQRDGDQRGEHVEVERRVLGDHQVRDHRSTTRIATAASSARSPPPPP